MEPTTTAVDDGGKGEILNDSRHLRADAAMVRRAVAQRWPVDDERRKKIADRMADIALQESPKVAVAAARVLREMDGMNQAEEHRVEDHERIDGGKATQAIKLYGQQTPVDDV